MEHFTEINWLGAFLAGIASMVVGGIWYSPLVAGKAWMKVSNFDPENAADPKVAMGTSLVSNILFAILLSLMMNETGAADAGLLVAAHYGLFAALLVSCGTWQNYAFENRSFTHFLIHTGNQVISMMVMAIVLVLV